ncbi:hypothetical protein HKBW3S03_00663 [Candidatus Hakubella thermalkaliphila]|uniref:Intracellular proteinase inhibitor BsuPI domain-containing protein n=1 Tax=Candidatus Hakubella thermalkaliphila TaxID=2754717 RepID=A0A6V8P9D3_9ACTN|nr:BsuPI-related putative proteinase inhibitor [Candidatus Hakubella thermalkaliphila]GFP19159.1 hypothetical protein HKBW3S03_00663 [Candidatus Hakubella thermalkaliphila]GFP29285.1 hypothetical protein HKBW3S34_00204 [Candidatus Hakubella thermalkaliphila]GFP38304.1 hypothetical protein HKBW3S47_00004 [Candidatus Hakubella thermalkaliphila]GFP41212.1 hypothetical protein HKBW3C_00338 [Candidatus Hakubella thermalkaliphila]
MGKTILLTVVIVSGLVLVISCAAGQNNIPEDIRVDTLSSGNFEATFSIDPYVTSGGEIRLALEVKSIGDEEDTIIFNSAQMYDFWVIDAQGQELWRWSADQAFAQVIKEVPLSPGQGMGFAETYNATGLLPGVYTLYARVNSSQLEGELTQRLEIKG